MRVYVQLLGTDTGDSSPSVLLYVEGSRGNRRYVLNFGEGMQRFFAQHKLRLARTDVFLLTRLRWEQLGGLPGGILTMADAGVKTVRLVGPRHTASFLEATRYFLIRPDLDFHVCELDGTNVMDTGFEDEGSRFVPIVLAPPCDAMDVELASAHPSPTAGKLVSAVDAHGAGRYHVRLGLKRHAGRTPVTPITDGSAVASTISHPEGPRETRPNVPLARVLPLPTDACQDVVCYALHTPTIPGTFKADVARALGVKKGTDFGLLARGQPVTVVNDQGVEVTVRPEDVKEPDQEGPVVLVLHVPSLAYLDLLLTHPTFLRYSLRNEELRPPVHAVVHLAPHAVLAAPAFAMLLAHFDAQVEHIVANRELAPVPHIFQSAAVHQLKLHALYAPIFPAPYARPTPALQTEVLLGPSQRRITPARPLLVLHLVPSKGLDPSACLGGIDAATVAASLHEPPELAAAVTAVQAAIAALPHSDANRMQPTLICLGTGAALPSKYRNVTGNFIEIPGKGCVLLDCGEGSYGQLFRAVGPERLARLLLDLHLVFVSHIHADHHLGLLRVLAMRQEAQTDRTLCIVGPAVLGHWLAEFTRHEPLAYHFVDIANITSPDHSNYALFHDACGLSVVQSVPVLHCPEAYGIVIGADGWKIVFSGDTRPCERLIECGRGCDLLIHEATFEDDLAHEARTKLHATTSEAIHVAQRMQARFLLMNHFSQRYPKIPSYTLPIGSDLGVGIAFDLMSLGLHDLAAVPLLLPALQLMFVDEEPDEDEVEMSQKKRKKVPGKAEPAPGRDGRQQSKRAKTESEQRK